ncbi:DUF6365 family protein [Streptomyces sp. WI04-05B]|uniref:DUF6365 family protein n=1 Tax=Streptomyces TaxID=1883 RepID=UPI0029A9273F|nr:MULTISPECIES: DUF6365 family protein [unclassified Streptomyces]MDX2545379.1 DUF6365 family protein [Streptomyces sp. WI04-05B]MDX2588126.1 DUF6365 family protein [Streptomyces sp. WI04-05A]MDX3749113.1 DUF6365 family protein [Streptomyces sp. AK08-02]
MSARRRTVLFVVTSFWAYGEYAIAAEFAARMTGSGFRPLFLVPPTHRGYATAAGLDHRLLIPGGGKINRIQLSDIEHTDRPALVVLADFMNYDFCDRHYGLTRADLAVFDCPIGTFDDFSWGREDTWLDTYGFRAKQEGEITVEGLAFRLRPCPLNNPLDLDAGPDVYAYPMLESVTDIGTAERAEVRRELGLSGDRPVVLVAGATWQHTPKTYPLVTGFVDASRTMMERLLTRLLEHADVVSMGSRLVFHDRDPEGFHALGPVPPERLGRLLQAVDLHISNNIVSVSLHRTALRGIPSVVLGNSLHKKAGRLTWDLPSAPPMTEFAQSVVDRVDYLYRCLMFPVGWHHFLTPLLADNPFADLVPRLETFTEEATLAEILPLLGAGPERDRIARARETYLEALRKLPGVDTVLHELTA